MSQFYSSLLSAFDIFFNGMNVDVKGFIVCGFMIACCIFFLTIPINLLRR